MNIAIVSFEFPGFTKNGGIGTAYGRMATLLKKEGHDITVLYVPIQDAAPLSKKEHQSLESQFKNINFEIVEITQDLFNAHAWPVARSLAVFQKLKERSFDVIHFHDCLGLGWASIRAKRLGLEFQKTRLVVGLHGPNFWVHDAHGVMISDPFEYLQNCMEREALEECDEVLSPSQYMVDYLRDWGWNLPRSARVIPNVNNFGKTKKESSSSRPIKKHEVDRLVFFGRLEPRKGIFLFLDALELLAGRTSEWSSLAPPEGLKIVFMGKSTNLHGHGDAAEYVAERLSRFKGLFNLEFYTDFTSENCQDYFKKNRNCLLCLPSLADNSPYAVVEALEQGLNFVSTDLGGQRELVHPDHHFDVFCPVDSHSFANMIIQKMTSEYVLPLPSKTLLNANSSWLAYHRKSSPAGRRKLNGVNARQSSGVSVVLNANELGPKFGQTIRSIAAQKVKPAEVVIVLTNRSAFLEEEDHKLLKPYLAKINGRILQAWGALEEGPFRKSLKTVKGDLLLFCRSGDILEPDAIKQLVSAKQRSPAEAFVIGFAVSQTPYYPHPIELNYQMFFDELSKFPIALNKDALSRVNSARVLLTGGLRSEEVFKICTNGFSFVAVPEIMIRNDQRQPFYPYGRAEYEVIRKRLREISSTLPRNFQRSMELSAGLLFLRSPD
ncbi:MAG: glycosyltransferase [Bdellovibrionales bacterium]